MMYAELYVASCMLVPPPIGTAMIARLLKMQSLGDEDEFFSSVSSVIATSPM